MITITERYLDARRCQHAVCNAESFKDSIEFRSMARLRPPPATLYVHAILADIINLK